MFSLEDYWYELPEERIAQEQVSPADASKLLLWGEAGFEDKQMHDLPSILTSNDVLFLNNTRVVKARIPLHHVRVVTAQGREVELEKGEIFFLQKRADGTFDALVTLLKRTRPGMRILWDDIELQIISLTDQGVIIKPVGLDTDALLQRYGHMPLPPYITSTEEKERVYQTVFAEHEGSVAAPTASLHFTPALLERLTQNEIGIEYVTLHVGLGTFKPVDTDDIRDYHIHAETMIISPSLFTRVAEYALAGNRIVGVGTTVARLLETLPYVWKVAADSLYVDDVVKQWWNQHASSISPEQTEEYIVDCSISEMHVTVQTRIFIYPGFHRRIVDTLVTNFHLPGSTLLMLVAAGMGYQTMKEAYAYAISHDYRFYSFGDAMFSPIQKNRIPT